MGLFLVDYQGKDSRGVVAYLIENRVCNFEALAVAVMVNGLNAALEPVMIEQVIELAGDNGFQQHRRERIAVGSLDADQTPL